MAPPMRGQRLPLLPLLVAASLLVAFAAGAERISMSLDQLDEQLQSCPVVQDLNAAKASHHASRSSSVTARLFGLLFPSSHPGINALLATLYISGPPNFLLALCPTKIDPSSLSVMVAFAVGGLMGDTLFHLLPEIFVGEDDHERARFVLVEPNRNLLLGLGILVGFMTFVAMDKGLRIATGGGSGHDHARTLSNSDSNGTIAIATGGNPADGQVRSRKNIAKKSAVEEHEHEDKHDTVAQSSDVKTGGYLNLIADFTHNITDGLAMAASFYASPTVGATTTVAVFFHEIPHEVGDFALLIQSGFSKRAAMASQFVTALGALVGTLIGIVLQELGRGSAAAEATAKPRDAGLWGTSLSWADMLLPFTVGTFLYVGTVAVIPDMLETGPRKAEELRKTLVQFAAVAVGAGIMLFISWHD